jgi:hypothetical protein
VGESRENTFLKTDIPSVKQTYSHPSIQDSLRGGGGGGGRKVVGTGDAVPKL